MGRQKTDGWDGSTYLTKLNDAHYYFPPGNIMMPRSNRENLFKKHRSLYATKDTPRNKQTEATAEGPDNKKTTNPFNNFAKKCRKLSRSPDGKVTITPQSYVGCKAKTTLTNKQACVLADLAPLIFVLTKLSSNLNLLTVTAEDALGVVVNLYGIDVLEATCKRIKEAGCCKHKWRILEQTIFKVYVRFITSKVLPFIHKLDDTGRSIQDVFQEEVECPVSEAFEDNLITDNKIVEGPKKKNQKDSESDSVSQERFSLLNEENCVKKTISVFMNTIDQDPSTDSDEDKLSEKHVHFKDPIKPANVSKNGKSFSMESHTNVKIEPRSFNWYRKYMNDLCPILQNAHCADLIDEGFYSIRCASSPQYFRSHLKPPDVRKVPTNIVRKCSVKGPGSSKVSQIKPERAPSSGRPIILRLPQLNSVANKDCLGKTATWTTPVHMSRLFPHIL